MASVPLFLLTFNCGKLKLNARDFVEELLPALPDTPRDLYVFGFQEICSILDGSFPSSVRKHLIDINNVLLTALRRKYSSSAGADFNFTTIGMNNLGAVGIVAITPFALKFDTCKFASASCGSANSLLKGAVGIRVKYTTLNSEPESTEFTFALAHLSAYEGEFYYQKRLDNIQTLMRALNFGDGYSFLKPNNHAFFMGDLNFRTTKSLKGKGSLPEDLKLLVDDKKNPSTKKISQLVFEYDELSKGRYDGEVFSGFDEASIGFSPTYKYHLGTAIYNTKRCPLWCDRILYQATYKSEADVKIESYSSISSYMRSDHRPVCLNVTVPVKAPESIIAANGYLVVLPVTPHVGENRHDPKLMDMRNSVSGPTQIYAKFTALDTLNQSLLRRISDFFIGYGLWFGTTAKGRLSLLGLVLSLWIVYMAKY